MSLLGRIFEKRDLSPANPKAYNSSLWNLYGTQSKTGLVVTEHNAMTFSAVWACVKILSDTIASLPLKLYEKAKDGGKTEIDNRTILRLFKYPNPEMSGFRLFHVLVGHITTWGNWYVYVLRDRMNRPIELWPLRPDKVDIHRDKNTGELFYVYLSDNGELALNRNQCWHLPGFGFDGIKGYSVIGQAREAIGLGMAAEEFGARYFGEGSHPSMIIKHPGKLSPDAHQSLKEDIRDKYAKLKRAHIPMLLEEGMDAITDLGMPHDDAQFLETRDFQVVEICRFFRVPPHLVQDLSKATYSNIEHQSIDFAMHSIRPWCVLLEKEMGNYWLGPLDRQNLFFEYKLEGLLRGDTQSRYSAYQTAIQSSWMSPNEARKLENLNPDPDLDFFMAPMNYIPVEQFTKEPEPIPQIPIEKPLELPPPEEEQKGFFAYMRNKYAAKKYRSAGNRHKIANTFKPLFAEAARAVIAREVKAVGRAVTRYLSERAVGDFDKWIDEFYEDMPEYIRMKFRPVLQSFAEAIQLEAAREIGAEEGVTAALQRFIDSYLDAYSNRHIASSMKALRKLIEKSTPEELADIVNDKMEDWSTNRQDMIADNETVRGNNAITRAVWLSAGVTTIVWVAMGSKPCPYCQELDGRTIGITSPFVTEGDYQPQGQEPMAIKVPHFHPPLHRGCVCGIAVE